ncbi:MAG: hypothetical protein MUO24_08315 [Desulfobacterales bacterium]|nr:hypothetical protein [Desulfobacterales bacterium]
MHAINFRKIFFTALLLIAAFPAQSFASTWAELSYDREVPLQTRQNLEKAVDTVADLLTKHHIVLPYKISIVVTADAESYIQALMLYAKLPRAKAEQAARNTAGESLGGKPIIIMKGTPRLNTVPVESFRVLPHEIFHQVQHQYGKTGTVNWLTEGAPEVFQCVARETAGFGTVNDCVRQAEQRIRQAASIPDARQLANYNYQTWTYLMPRYPIIYDMSVVMASRLVQDNGFENIVFFYQLLHNGTDRDKAFISAFRVPMAWFLSDMNDYFDRLRSSR